MGGARTRLPWRGGLLFRVGTSSVSPLPLASFRILPSVPEEAPGLELIRASEPFKLLLVVPGLALPPATVRTRRLLLRRVRRAQVRPLLSLWTEVQSGVHGGLWICGPELAELLQGHAALGVAKMELLFLFI